MNFGRFFFCIRNYASGVERVWWKRFFCIAKMRKPCYAILRQGVILASFACMGIYLSDCRLGFGGFTP